MSALDIVDINTHLWPPAWAPAGRYARLAQTLLPSVMEKITKPETQIAEFQSGSVSLAVVTATIESMFGNDGPEDFDALSQANDWLAARHESITAFGTTAAFAGDLGAREQRLVAGGTARRLLSRRRNQATTA